MPRVASYDYKSRLRVDYEAWRHVRYYVDSSQVGAIWDGLGVIVCKCRRQLG